MKNFTISDITLSHPYESGEKTTFQIPLLAPYITETESNYVQECIRKGWITTMGEFIEIFEQEIKTYTQSPYVVAVSSGTAALHLALRAVGVEKDTLVILPNISFVASANAIHYCGAEPLFVDIHPATWQLDENLLLRFLENECFCKAEQIFHKTTQKRISALVLVHNLGNLGNISAIQEICQVYQIPFVEDAAEALGSFYKGKHAGTFGKVGILSFNGNKIVSTGGGGAVLTKYKHIAEKVRHWANQAKISTEEYYHDEVGYNYRLPNPLAAIGVAQMEKISLFLDKKRLIHEFYTNILQEKALWQETLPKVEPNHWLFTALFENSALLAQKFKENAIQTRKLWYPLNRLPMHQKYTYVQENDFSWKVYEKSLSLPSSVGLQMGDLEKIAKVFESIEQDHIAIK